MRREFTHRLAVSLCTSESVERRGRGSSAGADEEVAGGGGARRTTMVTMVLTGMARPYVSSCVGL